MPGGSPDAARAARIEAGVYVAACLTYIALGVAVRSAVLNWIVGPAYLVAFVVIVTPIALRVLGVPDPERQDAGEGAP